MPFCTNCGNQEPEETVFCSTCGQPMSTSSIAAPIGHILRAVTKTPKNAESRDSGEGSSPKRKYWRGRYSHSASWLVNKILVVRSLLILIVLGGVVIAGIKIIPSAFHLNSNSKSTRPGTISKFVIPGSHYSPEVITSGPDGNLWFAGSNDKDRYSLIGRITPAGVIKTFPLPSLENVPAKISSSRGVSGIISGPDGNLWFIENITNFDTTIPKGDPPGLIVSKMTKIGRITPSGVIAEFSVPVPDGYVNNIGYGDQLFSSMMLISGPDGNLWFNLALDTIEMITSSHPQSTPTLCEIGRITPAGVITKISVLNHQTLPDDITSSCTITALTSSPDGNLWFNLNSRQKNKTNGETISTDHQIGRITRAGVVTEFPIPSSDASPGSYDTLSQITSGPDSNLWFILIRKQIDKSSRAETYWGSKIGRITPAGVVTEFSWLHDKYGVNPYQPDIIPGPDGKLWFTTLEGIGRITLAGVIAEFPVSAEFQVPNGYGPDNIMFGPDGNLWFTTVEGIGRITPAGSITKFPAPDSPAFTFGSDHNLWFLGHGNSIGRLTL